MTPKNAKMESGENMQHLMNGYSNIFVVAENTAKKWFSMYRDILRSDSFDVEDLVQEARVKVLETIRAYPEKNYDQVFKICNKSLTHHLIKMIRKASSIHTKRTPIQTELEDNLAEPTDKVIPIQFSEEVIFKYFHSRENTDRFTFQELLAVLDEKEYDVLKQVVVKGRTMEEVGQKLGCSKQRIDYILHKALNKAANYLGLQEAVDNRKKSSYAN